MKIETVKKEILKNINEIISFKINEESKKLLKNELSLLIDIERYNTFAFKVRNLNDNLKIDKLDCEFEKIYECENCELVRFQGLLFECSENIVQINITNDVYISFHAKEYNGRYQSFDITEISDFSYDDKRKILTIA